MLIQINTISRIAKDIELRYLSNGTALAKLSLVNSKKYTSNNEQKEDTCFIDATAFGKTAEVINQYCKKGDRIFIVGELKQENWTAQDGSNRSKHSISIESIEFIEKKDSDTVKTPPPPKAVVPKQKDMIVDSDETIPF